MITDDPKKLLEIGLKALEKGDYEEADYNLSHATFLFFAKGMLKEAVESGKLALEVKKKTSSKIEQFKWITTKMMGKQLGEYRKMFGDEIPAIKIDKNGASIIKMNFDELKEKVMKFLFGMEVDMAEFFYEVAQKMLKGEKLDDDVYRKFTSATAGIESSDPYYEFVIEAEKRVVEYMKSKGQKVPEEFLDDIEEFEESRKLKSEGGIIITNYSPKAGFLCGEYYGKLDLSGIKNVEVYEDDLGEVTYVFTHMSARFIIKSYGDFYVSGIKDEKHFKEIKRFLFELLAKGEQINFYKIDLEDGEIEAKFYGIPNLSGLKVTESYPNGDPNFVFYEFKYKDADVSIQYLKDRKIGRVYVYNVKTKEQAERIIEFLKRILAYPKLFI
jgi:hypothetical protein